MSSQDDVQIYSNGVTPEYILYAESEAGVFINFDGQERTTLYGSGQLCRLCARQADHMVYIFNDTGQALRIVEKINTSLPVTVRCDDQLPKQLCEDCVRKLEICHEFAETCIQAEEKLKSFSNEKLFMAQVVGDQDVPAANDICGKASDLDVTKYSCPLCCSGLMLLEDLNHLNDSSSISVGQRHVLNAVNPRGLKMTIDSSNVGGYWKKEKHVIPPVGIEEMPVVRNGEMPSLATCRICADVFKNIDDCLVHAKVHYMDDLFPCSVCDLCFSSEPSFLSHCVEHRHTSAHLEKPRCSSCGDKFSNAGLMAGHSCRRQYRCPECNKAFRSEARLAFHRQLHEGQSAATCRQCGKAFARETNLFEHVRLVHLGEKSHRCPHCGKTFQLRARLVAHMRIHSGERPFQCRVCGGRFYDKATLKGHLITHLDVKPFQCDKCGRCFSRKTLFKHHVLSHDKAVKTPLSRMYKCKLCPNVACVSYPKLVEHRKENHPAEEFVDEDEQLGLSKPFTCDYCEKSFAYRVTLISHERTHTGELPFQCEFCEKKFPQKRSLILHRRIHTGEKPYVCLTCGKRFIQSAHLYAHRRLHTGEKPYECAVCGETFRLKDVRDAHCRKHTGERPFKCTVCEKAFRTSHSYYQHMWIHQGKKPYVCQHCGKAFRRSNGLKIHTRIHTGEKPHVCDICSKCFAQKQDMKKHRNLHANGRL